MKRNILIIALFISFIIFGTITYYRYNPLSPKVRIHGQLFTLEAALTAAQREKGLGYRNELPLNHGMIFGYDHKDTYMFWMKGMNFPLDFLWIDGQTIVDISQNVPVISMGKITTIKPRVPVDKVIEFPAGTIQVNKIKIGDTISFTF